MSPTFKDIIVDIKQQGSKALAPLYTTYRVEFIQWMTYRLGCDTELAKDIYQQTILALYENIQNGKLIELTSGLKTYLFSIGKNKYYEFVREQERKRGLKADDETASDTSHESLLQKVEACLERLGEPCRSLLMHYYYHKRSMEQLAELFSYKNVDTAKNQKYKCLERLRKMVKEDVQLSTGEE